MTKESIKKWGSAVFDCLKMLDNEFGKFISRAISQEGFQFYNWVTDFQHFCQNDFNISKRIGQPLCTFSSDKSEVFCYLVKVSFTSCLKNDCISILVYVIIHSIRSQCRLP